MDQETTQQQEQPHILDQVIVHALPPEFHHSDIAKHYQDGAFTSRLDAEVADILRACQPAEESGEGAPIPLTGEALEAMRQLNCIALIQDGQVLPLLDIEQTAAPMTALQRVHLYHSAARTLLEAIAAIYEDRFQQTKIQDDDNEDRCSV
ncbi:MAG: hypothetical protein ACRDIV_17620 [Ktedonobacteraceae bacterium]